MFSKFKEIFDSKFSYSLRRVQSVKCWPIWINVKNIQDCLTFLLLTKININT